MLDYFSEWSPSLTDDGEVEPTLLFTVRARYDPSDEAVDDLPIIAEIVLTSELYRSTFGDERLFFQHSVIGRDIWMLNDIGEKDRRKAFPAEWLRQTWIDSCIIGLPSKSMTLAFPDF